jgi:hypothetical protein
MKTTGEYVAVSVVLAVLLLASCNRTPDTQNRMPIYITPFYDSAELHVEVGEYSHGLRANDRQTVQETIADMKINWPLLRPDAMYVAAIRLYDLGLKDESVYWFYSAQYRSKLFTILIDQAHVDSHGGKPFELKQAYDAFHQLAGEYINGYAFGNPVNLARTVAQVQDEGLTLPSVRHIYPQIPFIDETLWEKENLLLNDDMTPFIETLLDRHDEIIASRKAAGIEKKY